MKVQNMLGRTGHPVANQFIITADNGSIVFQSYKTVIAKKEGGKVYLDTQYNYSKTTSKYLYQFLAVDRLQFKANIIHGVYIVTNLN